MIVDVKDVANSLYAALAATSNLIGAIRLNTGFSYVAGHTPDQSLNAAIDIFTSCHAPLGSTANTTLHGCGLVTVVGNHIIELADQANILRAKLGSDFSLLNKKPGIKGKASGVLAEYIRTCTRHYPFLFTSRPVCIRQISRQFIVLDDVNHIGFYKENIRRCERVDYGDLVKMIDNLPDARRSIYANQIVGIPQKNLRYIFEGKTTRYRANIKFNDGSRKGISVSMPSIVIGDKISYTPLEQSRTGNSARSDTCTYAPLIPGLNLYEKL